MTRILGLDPGEATGYCLLDFNDGEKLSVVNYGTIPIVSEGRKGMVIGTADWLMRHIEEWNNPIVVLSEIVQMPGRPTSHKAVEIQGVCRLYAEVGYNPMSTHSTLKTKKKKDARAFAIAAIGIKLAGASDHVYDAAAVAMSHAMRMGVWYPIGLGQQLDLPAVAKKSKRQSIEDIEPDQLTNEQVLAGIKNGTIRLGSKH